MSLPPADPADPPPDPPSPPQAPPPDPLAEGIAALLQAQPIGALGTLHGSLQGDPATPPAAPPEPMVSMVPLAWLPGRAEPVVHLSALAPHTRDLQRHPLASLMLVAPRAPDDEPLALARLTLQVRAEPIADDDPLRAEAAAAYAARFATAALTMTLGDFRFWRLVPQSARWVAGFGRAHALDAARFRAVAASAIPAPAGAR